MYIKDLHSNIKKNIDNFIINKNIPHIIFYGPYGSGKKHLLNYLLNKFYSEDNKKKYTLYINCTHYGGINFIKNELKYFSKCNLYHKKKLLFKSVILFNADKLTIDAQSALRRSIENYSNTTRFFIIVNDKNKLLKPIISRFCNIYVPYYNNINLYNLNKTKNKKLKKYLEKCLKNININNIVDKVNIIYNNGISSLDIKDYLMNKKNKDYLKIIHFLKIKNEFKNEKFLIFNILFIFFIRKDLSLKNINNL